MVCLVYVKRSLSAIVEAGSGAGGGWWCVMVSIQKMVEGMTFSFHRAHHQLST